MASQTLQQVISAIQTTDNESFVYAQRINGVFTALSPAVVLELTEEEMDMRIADVAQKRCPGFDYFLETSIIKDMMEEFDAKKKSPTNLKEKVERIIHYAEYDA